MDVTLLALPQSQDRLQEAFQFLAGISQKNSLSQEEKIKASVFAALLEQSDRDRIVASLDTSFNEDANFYGASPGLKLNLDPKKEIAKAAMTNLSLELNKIASNDLSIFKNNKSLKKLYQSNHSALYGLHYASFKELDWLLEKRIESFEASKQAAIIWTALALAFSSALAFLVSKNLVNRVKVITSVSKKIASGETNSRVALTGGDELAELGQSFNLMTDKVVGMSKEITDKNETLKNINANLEKNVADRTASLNKRNEEMKVILDNAEQGFMTLDRNGHMLPEHSQCIERWFGNFTSNIPFWDYIGENNNSLKSSLKFNWLQMMDDVLPLEMSLEQMPSQMSLADLQLGIKYRPIMNANNVIEKMLLMITDESAMVKQKLLEIESAENMKIFQSIMRDKAGFLEFVAETEPLIYAIHTTQSIGELKRNLHTVKGNSSLYGLMSLADFCHQCETSFEESGPDSLFIEKDGLKALWEKKMLNVMSFLGEKSSHKIQLDHKEYSHAIDRIRNGADANELESLLLNWAMEPLSNRFERIAAQAQRIGEKTGKSNLLVDITHNNIRSPNDEYSDFFISLVHAVRNAVDHGIESPEERIKAGKAPEGKISLKAWKESGSSFCLQIADDGRGIDWNKVESKALKMGIRCNTDQERLKVLFSDGFSTRESISDISGRGVGLSALENVCKENGIEIKVTSTFGKGTEFTFVFPLKKFKLAA